MLRVLDLFCGAGGATAGYLRAGFEVVGVDINPQPDYPGTFVQGDALEYVQWAGGQADLIHASPPCQFGLEITSGTNAKLGRSYPNLYDPTRELLEEIGVPYVIECGRKARPDVKLCGEMFSLRVIRHRNFEMGGWTAAQPKHVPHRGLTLGMRHGKLVTEQNGGHYYAVYGDGGYKGTVIQWQTAMGIGWTDNRKSLAEALPPSYTQYIGRQFINQTREAQQ